MDLSLKIARRYLLSKKSHNVINIISIVSAVAIGMGCMALIIILSVFNGFNRVMTQMYSESSPDFIIEPYLGKVLNLTDSSVVKIENICKEFALNEGEVVDFVPVVSESAYLQSGNVQCVGKIKGVASLDGSVVVSEALSRTLDISLTKNDSITIFVPSRTGEISLLMPMESVWSATLAVDDIMPDAPSGENLLAEIPLNVAQYLLEYYDNEANSVEIFVSKSNRNTKKLIKIFERKIRSVAGANLSVKNFYEQNSTIYKMMRSEKLAVYLILFFVILIIGVNILSSVAIMIIEKQEDIQTLKTMGAGGSLLRRAFTLHGVLICMAGAVVGLSIGLIICWLQQHYGIVSLPGSFITSVYPVAVRLSDIIIILAGVLAICLSLSYIPSLIIKR